MKRTHFIAYNNSTTHINKTKATPPQPWPGNYHCIISASIYQVQCVRVPAGVLDLRCTRALSSMMIATRAQKPVFAILGPHWAWTTAKYRTPQWTLWVPAWKSVLTFHCSILYPARWKPVSHKQQLKSGYARLNMCIWAQCHAGPWELECHTGHAASSVFTASIERVTKVLCPNNSRIFEDSTKPKLFRNICRLRQSASVLLRLKFRRPLVKHSLHSATAISKLQNYGTTRKDNFGKQEWQWTGGFGCHQLRQNEP